METSIGSRTPSKEPYSHGLSGRSLAIVAEIFRIEVLEELETLLHWSNCSGLRVKLVQMSPYLRSELALQQLSLLGRQVRDLQLLVLYSLHEFYVGAFILVLFSWWLYSEFRIPNLFHSGINIVQFT